MFLLPNDKKVLGLYITGKELLSESNCIFQSTNYKCTVMCPAGFYNFCFFPDVETEALSG